MEIPKTNGIFAAVHGKQKTKSNVLDSEDEDDFTQREITGTEQISENNYDLEAPTLENDNEILVHKNNEHKRK